MTRPLRDTDIRKVITAELEQQHAHEPRTLIRHELGLCAGERRVDLAVINGELAGYEIKSDVDTLGRLAGQAEAYGRVFDRMSIVTTDRYLDTATAALPSWWGIVRVARGGTGTTAQRVRPARLNRTPDPFALAQLLWREEALEEMRRRGLARGLARKRRWFVWKQLAETVPISELQQIVRSRLKERRDWPSGW